MTYERVITPAEWEPEDLARDTDVVADSQARLPAWVFKRREGYTAIFDRSWLLSDRYISMLMCLGRHYGDDYLTLRVVDPEPEIEDGQYVVNPGFRIPLDSVEERYADLVHIETHAEHSGWIPAFGEVVVVTGSSHEWAIWIEGFWEVGVVYSRDDVQPWMRQGSQLDSSRTGLDIWPEAGVRGRGVTIEEMATLAKNYIREDL